MELTVRQLNSIIKELAFGEPRTVHGDEADKIRARAKPDIEQKLKEGAIIDLLIEVEEDEEDDEDESGKPVSRAFCPTGEGGDIDNSCSPANKGESMASVTGTGEPSDNLGGDLSKPAGGEAQQWLPFIGPDDVKANKLAASAKASNEIVEKILNELEEEGIEVETETTWDTLDDDEKESTKQEYIDTHIGDRYDELIKTAKEEHVDEAAGEAEWNFENHWADIAKDESTALIDDFFAHNPFQTIDGKAYTPEHLEAFVPDVEYGDLVFDDDAIRESGISQEQLKATTDAIYDLWESRRSEQKEAYIEEAKETALEEFDETKHNERILEEAWQDVSNDFYNLDEEEKLKFAGYEKTKTVSLELPDTWKVDKNGEDYKKTREIVRYIQNRVMKETLESRGLSSSESEDAIAESWKAWKTSSTHSLGLLMQDATSEELGGMVQQWTDAQKATIDRAAMSFAMYADQYNEDMPEKERVRLGREMMKAHIRGTWAATQVALKNAGIDEVVTYRAILIDNEKIANEKTSAANVSGRDYNQLPDIALRRNGLASTALGNEGLSVANSWNGVDLPKPRSEYERVVLRIKAPAAAVVSIPAFGQNIHAEREAVISGTTYEWDAWKDSAPSLDKHPMTPPKKEKTERAIAKVKRSKTTNKKRTPTKRKRRNGPRN
jgi:hypothetical protein